MDELFTSSSTAGTCVSLQQLSASAEAKLVGASYGDAVSVLQITDSGDVKELSCVLFAENQRCIDACTSTANQGLMAITRTANARSSVLNQLAFESASSSLVVHRQQTIDGVATCCATISNGGTLLGLDEGRVVLANATESWSGSCSGGAGPAVRAVQPWKYSEHAALAACGSTVYAFDRRSGSSPSSSLASGSPAAGQAGGLGLPALAAPVTCLATDEEDPWAVLGGTADGRIVVWDMRQAKSPVQAPVALHTGAVRATSVVRLGQGQAAGAASAQGAMLVTAGDDGVVRRLDLTGPLNSCPVSTVLQASGPLRCLAVHLPGRARLTGQGTGLLLAGGTCGGIHRARIT